MSRSGIAMMLALLVLACGCDEQARVEHPLAVQGAATEAASGPPFTPPLLDEGFVHVFDMHGRPVEGATVWRLDADSPDAPYSRMQAQAVTDAQGRAPVSRTEGVASRWHAYRSGYAISIEEGRTRPEADPVIVLRPSSDRRVRVLGPDNEPVPGARLIPTVSRPESLEDLHLETDADGYATLSLSSDYHHPLGYSVIAPGLAAEYYRETTDVVRLQQGGSVLIRATGADDPANYAGCAVIVRSRSAVPAITFAGRDHVLIDHCAPGEIEVFMRPSGSDRFLPTMAQQSMTVRPGETVEHEIEFQPAWPVSGLIRGEDGAAIADVAVVIHRGEAGGATPRTYTDAEGRYSLHLLPGDYHLFPYGARSHHVFSHLVDDVLSFTVAAGEATNLPTFTIPVGLTIRGRVVAEDGSTVTGAEVLWLGETTAAMYGTDRGLRGLSDPIAITDENGEFASSGWRPWGGMAFAARTDDAISSEPLLTDLREDISLELPISRAAASWIRGSVRTTYRRPVTRTSVSVTMGAHPRGRIVSLNPGPYHSHT